MLQVEAGTTLPSFNDRQRALRDLPAPEPAAGLAAYERERELAPTRSPETRDNYAHYLASRRRNAVVITSRSSSISKMSAAVISVAPCAPSATGTKASAPQICR